MKFMVLLYENEENWNKLSETEQQEIFSAHMAFTEAAKAAGVLGGGEPLEPHTTATTLRRRNGRLTQTDGPFAETKEQLGGFYILECKDLDEATEWAAKIPEVDRGSVEIRPIMSMG